jgi:hypothetical protein
MSDDNLDAWTKANNNRTYYAIRLSTAHIDGDTAEVERFAGLFREAGNELDRINREYMGEQ